MANYKFDGENLKLNGRRMARINRDRILDDKGRSAGRFKDEKIYDAKGRSAGRFDGRYLFDGKGRRIADRRQIEKDIDGNGGTSLAALWLLFVR